MLEPCGPSAQRAFGTNPLADKSSWERSGLQLQTRAHLKRHLPSRAHRMPPDGPCMPTRCPIRIPTSRAHPLVRLMNYSADSNNGSDHHCTGTDSYNFSNYSGRRWRRGVDTKRSTRGEYPSWLFCHLYSSEVEDRYSTPTLTSPGFVKTSYA